MKKASCILLAALLMLLCGAALAENTECYHANMVETASTNPTCQELGTQTWTCSDCGYEEVTTWGVAGECWFELCYDQNNHWYGCKGCGAIDGDKMAHEISCVNAGLCNYCGATGVSGEVAHESDGTWQYDNAKCWLDCINCSEKIFEYQHWNFCDSPSACIICGQTGVTISVYHDFDQTTGKCTICGQAEVVEEHDHVWEVSETVAPTCTEFGNEHSVCTICSEGSDKQLYPTGHYWVVTKTVDATAEREGRIEYACRDCDATSLKRLPATGAAEETPAEETAEETAEEAVEETAEVAVKAVENVTVEAAEGEALSSDVALIVSEPEEDVSATLPEEIKENVAKVYFVKLTEKGEEITPAGSLKIAIQLEEGADLTGKKLMLVKEDGTLVEIEYEIVEGKLVFVTDAIGTFVLVDAPAE